MWRFPLLLTSALAANTSVWKQRSIYQLLTDRFAGPAAPCSNLHDYCGGTWEGITAHLDYIQALGFDAVWISPVVDNAPGGYHGYWQQNMTAPNAHFGGWADLDALSAALHDRSMLLMVDVVANHASPSQDVSANAPFSSPASYHDCAGCPGGCSVADYHDLTQMEHCRLAGLMDFDQTDEAGPTATTLYAWISSLVSSHAIDGLRVDTVPYVRPAFWRRFEAAAGVFAVGEVDDGGIPFVAPFQAPSGADASLSGVLAYPLFFTLRAVFQQRGSMRALGDAWRQAGAAFADVGALGAFTDNHDNPRFLAGSSCVGCYRGALAYTLLAEGIPIVYYGSEWLFRGGGDPDCREALWGAGAYNASAAPLGPFLLALNEARRSEQLWLAPQVERWQDDAFYAFSRGRNLAVFTNVGEGGAPQSRRVTYLPEGFGEGARACNALPPCGCGVVQGGAFVTPPLSGGDGAGLYVLGAGCSAGAR